MARFDLSGRNVVVGVFGLALVAGACGTSDEPATLDTSLGEVIVFDQELAAYGEAVAAGGSTELYGELVVDPVVERCSGGGRYDAQFRRAIDDPPTDAAAIDDALAAIDAERLQRELVDELTALQEVLPGGAVTVCVTITADQEPGAATGHTDGVLAWAEPGTIMFAIDPGRASSEMIRYAMAHEYHHTWSFERQVTEHRNLLGHMVMEGRADRFASEQHPDLDVPWLGALTPEQEAELWSEISGNLDSIDPHYNGGVMFGHHDIPHGAGYQIGHAIVSAYLDHHPDATVEEWSTLLPGELFEQSGYPVSS